MMLTGSRLHLGRHRGGERAVRARAGAERSIAGAAHRRRAGLELRRARPRLVRARALAPGRVDTALAQGLEAMRIADELRPALQPVAGGDLPRAAAAAAWRRRPPRDARRSRRWRSPPSRGRPTTAPGRRSWSATPRPSGRPGRRDPSARCGPPSTCSARAGPGCGCPTTSGCWPERAARPGGPPRGSRCSTRRWPRRAAATSAGGTPSCTGCAGDLRLAAGARDDEAGAAYLRALEIARAMGARSLELRAATSLARLRRDACTPGGADPHFR